MNKLFAKNLISIIIISFVCNGISQSLDPIVENPKVVEINKLAARSTFFHTNQLI